ncbi:MAG TPA: AbrB/MazE/SpoVT family DNA-binding domain-containing protein [Candidatus Limnocylindrales bacterium]|nr:AbrB/MazE/SpoVT family DNA-binding domain-containing protein [Candidatus Limnocylindrales bacterium]
MVDAVTAEARLRRKSQLTLPDPIVQAANVGEGDRFVVEVAPDEPDTITLRKVRPSYAGALGAVYGDTDEYLQLERATWGR